MTDYHFVSQSDITSLRIRLTKDIKDLNEQITKFTVLIKAYQYVLEQIDMIEGTREQKEQYGS